MNNRKITARIAFVIVVQQGKNSKEGTETVLQQGRNRDCCTARKEQRLLYSNERTVTVAQ